MRPKPLTAIGLVGIVWIAALGLQLALDPKLPGLEDAILTGAFLLFFGVAALLVLRVPDNAVSWVMLAIVSAAGLWFLFDGVANLGERLGTDWIEQVAGFLAGAFLFALFPLVVAVLPLLFPTGAPPTPRWRWVWTVAVVGYVVILTTVTIVWATDGYEAAENVEFDPTNPVRVVMFGGLVLWLASFVGGVASLVVRWHRSEGVERAQLRWLVPSFTIFSIGVVTEFGIEQDNPVALVGMGLGVVLVPVSIGFAITKYRLYDIGRIVSRTVTYAVLAVLIVVAYAVGAVWLPTRLGIDSPILVAATTLAIAVAFNPVRRWLTGHLDRRFNRTPYDPDVVVDALAAELRDSTDPSAIAEAWASTAQRALQPESLSVWVAE